MPEINIQQVRTGRESGVRESVRQSTDTAKASIHKFVSSVDQSFQHHRAGPRAPLWNFAKSLALTDDRRSTNVVPEKFAILTRNDIANILSVNRIRKGYGNEFLGDYYCLYGVLGGSFSLQASIDIGELAALTSGPLGLKLSLKFALKAGGGTTGEILLMTHKAFQRTKMSTIIDPQSNTYKIIDRGSHKPVCLLNLQGYQHEGSVTLGASAEAGIGPSISIAGLPLQINLASFAAGITFKAQTTLLEDMAPMTYSSILDSELNDKLYAYSSPGREELKVVIDQWRDHLKSKVLSDKILKDNPALKAHLNIQQAFSLKNKGRAGSDQVLKWLDDLKKIIELWNSHDSPYREIINQIVLFAQSLNFAKYNDEERDIRSGLSSPTGRPKTYVRTFIFSFSPNAKVSVGPSISSAPSLGSFSAEFSASAQASASVTGELHFVSERYQTTNTDKQGQLIAYTQDTKITYSSVLTSASLEITAEVSATAGSVSLWESPEAGVNVQKKCNRRDILYHSANIHRRHGADWSISGSSLAIGLSVDIKMIFILKRASKEERDKILNKRPFHRYLGVSHEQLLTFFDSIPGEYLKEMENTSENHVVIIEAGHLLNAPSEIKRNTKNYIENLVDKFFKNKKHEGKESFYLPTEGLSTLQTLRCRVRSGDISSQSRRIFGLGFSAIIGIEAQADRIMRAGNSFLEDIWVRSYMEDDSFPLVSPTVLLPHTLELF